jgi:hypothetical protein
MFGFHQALNPQTMASPYGSAVAPVGGQTHVNTSPMPPPVTNPVGLPPGSVNPAAPTSSLASAGPPAPMPQQPSQQVVPPTPYADESQRGFAAASKPAAITTNPVAVAPSFWGSLFGLGGGGSRGMTAMLMNRAAGNPNMPGRS